MQSIKKLFNSVSKNIKEFFLFAFVFSEYYSALVGNPTEHSSKAQLLNCENPVVVHPEVDVACTRALVLNPERGNLFWPLFGIICYFSIYVLSDDKLSFRPPFKLPNSRIVKLKPPKQIRKTIKGSFISFSDEVLSLIDYYNFQISDRFQFRTKDHLTQRLRPKDCTHVYKDCNHCVHVKMDKF